MKKLLLSLAVCASLSSAAFASPITIDPTADGDLSDSVTFDKMDFIETKPFSYYVDSSEDGFVNNGEFVFDFANNIDLGALTIGADADRVDNNSLFAGTYSLVADYLLIGNAVVNEVSAAQAQAASNVQKTAQLLGLTSEDYIVLCAGNPADMVLQFACSNSADDIATVSTISTDGKIDGSPNETLFANITDGLFNLFLTDEQGNRLALAASFDVRGLAPSVGGNGQVTVNILGDVIQATDNVLYDQYGNSFASILDNGGIAPSLLVDTNITADVNSIPGSETSVEVGQSNSAGATVTNTPLFYFTDAGFDAWDITAKTNGLGCGVADALIPFGGCSALIGEFEADDKWDELKDIIRSEAGCVGNNGNRKACEFDVLARSTLADASATIEASAPGHVLLAGLALLALGIRRKFA